MKGPAPRKTRILCVDDDPAANRIHTIVLGEQVDLEVVAATTRADEVLPAIETHQPDVVLLDYLIRGARCEDLVRQIAAAHPAVRVIILSGMDQSVASALLAAGACAFVPKHPDLNGFLEDIRVAIGSSPRSC